MKLTILPNTIIYKKSYGNRILQFEKPQRELTNIEVDTTLKKYLKEILWSSLGG